MRGGATIVTGSPSNDKEAPPPPPTILMNEQHSPRGKEPSSSCPFYKAVFISGKFLPIVFYPRLSS